MKPNNEKDRQRLRRGHYTLQTQALGNKVRPEGKGLDSDAGAVIRALVCGYSRKALRSKLMVALQAFVDDSASEDGDRRLVLAAYVNFAERWAEFSEAWSRELKRPPSVDYFKMTEAANFREQFAGWSPSARDEKVVALAKIIAAFGSWFIYCSVSRKEHDAILAPVSPQPLKGAYFSCFWGIIQTTARYHQTLEAAPPVDFIFDDQEGVGDQAVLWYRWLKEGQDPRIKRLLGATPIFRDDKEVMPLQAADMLAWHVRRGQLQLEADDGVKREVTRLLTSCGGAGIHIDKVTLEGIARRTSRVPGVHLVQTKSDWRKVRRTIQSAVVAGLPAPPDISLVRMRLLYIRVWLKNAISRIRHPRRKTRVSR